MKILFSIFFLFSITACYLNTEVTKKYELYFDDNSWELFQKGMNAYKNEKYILADSLLTDVIEKSKDKLSILMPTELNPYYYRGHNYIELNKYQEALTDFNNVASDTTMNTDILMARTDAFRMLKQYDKAIVLCNRLLNLKSDSAVALSQRGLCYYQKGDKENACADLQLFKKLATGNISYYDKFLKDCK